jgi:hypothetical protein
MNVTFFTNILWLNIKKLRTNIFWKVVFILINFLLFFSTTLRLPDASFLPQHIFFFIFILVSLSNILFCYVKIFSEQPVISLLRSMGASKTFIIINNVAEVKLLFLISLLLFAGAAFFRAVVISHFIISLCEILLLITVSMIFSIIAIVKVEKTQKAL